jgi:two-component system response regulator PilR (NtrC family)
MQVEAQLLVPRAQRTLLDPFLNQVCTGMKSMNRRHLRILVIEDEPLIRWSIAETLGDEGHTVMEATDAASAVSALEQQDGIDVVLLDYRLPDSSDLQLLAQVRRLRPDSAVVMMTAYGTADMIEGALALGAYRVVGKPFDMQTLESLVVEATDARIDPVDFQRGC